MIGLNITLTGAQRKTLRGMAHSLKPIVNVGKNGITAELIKNIDEQLLAHELIKIKFVEFKEEKDELAARIEELTHAHCAGIIGNIAIFYRPNPKNKRIQI